MNITTDDQKLINIASKLVNPHPVPGGIVSEVGSALRTSDGKIYTGVCMHLVCGLGFCGEHTAIATAITNDGAISVDTIVAVNKHGIIPPCGRCRELMNVISANGSETWVILSEDEKVQVADLLPRSWNPNQSLSNHLATES